MRDWLIKLLGGFTLEDCLYESEEQKKDYAYLLERTITALELFQNNPPAPPVRKEDPEPVDTRRTPFTIRKRMLEQQDRQVLREANREAEKLEASWKNRQ